MSNSIRPPSFDDDGSGTGVATKTKPKTKRPALYRVLLLNDPTRGVDVGTKQDIYRLLAELTAQGVAIVMLSTEVDELVELMERVLVFREHELFAELPREALSASRLVATFFGQEHARVIA